MSSFLHTASTEAICRSSTSGHRMNRRVSVKVSAMAGTGRFFVGGVC